MPHEDAVAIMREGRGTHFDPDILDAFLELHEEFREIAERFSDSDEDLSRKQNQIEASLAGVARSLE
jgi:putative two-component system response regulator